MYTCIYILIYIYIYMHAHTRKYLSVQLCHNPRGSAGRRGRGSAGVRGDCSHRKKSATGTETRVARVRAEYPNQLDYSGSDRCHTLLSPQLGLDLEVAACARPTRPWVYDGAMQCLRVEVLGPSWLRKPLNWTPKSLQNLSPEASWMGSLGGILGVF